jgi:hypothetical protein
MLLMFPASASRPHPRQLGCSHGIDATGRVREEISDDPGPAMETTQSSFAALLADAATSVIGKGQ